MSARTIATVATASPQPGSGILHPFPTSDLPHIDPFVFLDTGAPRNLGGSDIYVGPHSHRGVQPVSLLFRGHIEHRDSLGNERSVRSGGMQWLVAGSGAMHEEVLRGDEDGVFHMAQLWINVPSDRKMDPPEHHALEADAIPEITDAGSGSAVRLFAGRLGNNVGPAPMPTNVVVAHVALSAGGEVTLPVTPDWTAAFTTVAGVVESGGKRLGQGDTPVFNNDGTEIRVTSAIGGELLLMAGEPIGEPIVIGGGFVMTSREEIEAAFADERSGRMGELAPSR